MSPEERAWFQSHGDVLSFNIVFPAINTLFFGIATGLFVIAMCLNLGRELQTLPRKVMFGAILATGLFHAISMFSYIAIVAEQIIAPFLRQVSGGAVDDYAILNVWAEQIQLVINDSIVVWRACVLYPDKKWARFAPCSLLAGAIVFSFVDLVLASIPTTDVSNSSEDWTIPNTIDTVAFGLSFVTNLVATLLILHRLIVQFRSHRLYLGQRRSMTSGQRILHVLVESGFVFCALQAIVLTMSSVSFPYYGTGDFIFATVQSIFWSSMSFFPLTIFIIIHTETSFVETFGFSEVLNVTLPDIERIPSGSIGEPAPEDPVTTSAGPMNADLVPKAHDPSDSRDLHILETRSAPSLSRPV